MLFPDNRYSFVRAKLTGLFSFLFYPGSQKNRDRSLERELGMWDWEDKKAKKTTVLPTLQCLRGTHEKANLESKNETHSPREKERKRKKKKEMQSKTCFFSCEGENRKVNKH